MLILIYMSKTENVIPRALKNVHLFNMTLALGGATSSNSSCRDKREKKLCVGGETWENRKRELSGKESQYLWRARMFSSVENQDRRELNSLATHMHNRQRWMALRSEATKCL